MNIYFLVPLCLVVFTAFSCKHPLIDSITYFIVITINIYSNIMRWALVLLALLEWADARTGRADLSRLVPGMHSCLFACHWKAVNGETPTLASFGVSAIRYGYRTMIRNALTRASPTREHDRWWVWVWGLFRTSALSHACKTPYVEGAGAAYLPVRYPRGEKKNDKQILNFLQEKQSRSPSKKKKKGENLTSRWG
jgi:hypothetical protein